MLELTLTIVTALAPPPAIQEPTAHETVLVTGARVLAPDGASWLDDRIVVLEGDRILAVLPTAEADLSGDARSIDLDGLHLVPGLIDLHTHLLLHPYDEASWESQVLKESLELRTVRAVAAAKATLESGFTTIRELGTEGAGFADVALRDAIRQGIVPGPRILASTRALVATGCYGPSGFDPRWSVPKGAQEADGPDGVRRAVREQVAAGADWIKVYADYRRRKGDPSTPTFSLEELEAIIDEARSAGLPVAAHASTPEAMSRAIEAGVQTIEHGTGATDEVLAAMKQAGVALCPTLAAGDAIARYSGWDGGDPEPERVARARATFVRALESGVTIACGSDAGVFSHGDSARELELCVACGMSPTQALRSATSVAAKVLGLAGELGRIDGGFVADLVAVAGDPLADISSLRDVRAVIQGGDLVFDGRLIASPDEEQAIVAVCRAMLESYSNKDLDAVSEQFAPGATVSFDFQENDTQVSMSIEQFLERARENLSPETSFREWFSGEPEIRVDGRIATLWVPFLLELGKRRATGNDVFQLVKLDGAWKIAALAFTNRGL